MKSSEAIVSAHCKRITEVAKIKEEQNLSSGKGRRYTIMRLLNYEPAAAQRVAL